MRQKPETMELLQARSHILTRCREAWPTIKVDEHEFVDHVLGIAAGDGGWEDVPGRLATLHTTDLYLAFGCMRGDGEAHRIFVRTILSAVPRHIAQLSPDAAFAAEVRQDLASKLLVGNGTREPNIGLYRGEGALVGWIRVVAIRAARSRLRRSSVRRNHPPGHGVDPIDTPHLDPELALIKRRYAAIFADALQSTLAALDVDARNILRLHYVDGLRVEDLARAYRVSRATANRSLMKARGLILRGVRQRLEARLGASTPDMASLLGLVQSQLNVSIRKCFEVGPDLA